MKRLTTILSSWLLLCACSAPVDVEELNPAQLESLLVVQSSQSQVVLLELYLTTCPHCNNQLPILQDVAQTYQDYPFTIIALALDSERQSVASYSRAKELPFETRWLVDWSSTSLHAALAPSGIDLPDDFGVPFLALLGKDGQASAQWPGYTSEVDIKDGINQALTQ